MHSVTFQRNPLTYDYFARCSCGWSMIGPKIEVQARAATHDMDEPMTLPDTVPADAETVSYFEQIITERVPSRHLPGRYSITRWFVCPGCQVRGPALPILTITRCACGLYLHANATDLHVWRAPATEAAE